MYSGAMWLSQAIEKIGGNFEDRDAFLAAVLEHGLVDSPLGKTVKLDAYGNPIYDVTIRKVVKRPDGKFWNVPITTYPNVSQFWNYDPETYMKQPPYSRTFQGIKKSLIHLQTSDGPGHPARMRLEDGQKPLLVVVVLRDALSRQALRTRAAKSGLSLDASALHPALELRDVTVATTRCALSMV